MLKFASSKLLRQYANRLPDNTQRLLSGITHTNTILQSASKRIHSIHCEICSLPLYLTLSFCCCLCLFFPLVPPLSFSPHVQALRKSKTESCLCLPATVLTHTSSNTDCRLIKGATYLLSTHRASHLNRLPGTLDTSKTITVPKIFHDNV